MRAAILALLLAAAPALAQTMSPAWQRCLDGPGAAPSGYAAARPACGAVADDAGLPP